MRIGIVGLGLIGGSLGLALRRLRHSIDVTGVARRAESAAAAVQRGAVDRASTDLRVVSECDLVVLAPPIDQIARLVERLPATVRARTLVAAAAGVYRRAPWCARRRAT